MPYQYDPENIFAKILRGEIPNQTVAETEHTLAFNDIYPQAPIHVLVIPKGAYVCADHFALEASDAEIVDFWRTVGRICAELVFGYYRHPKWETEGEACYRADDLEEVESIMPGMAAAPTSIPISPSRSGTATRWCPSPRPIPA